MKQRAPWARRIGVALILFWSLAPLYWAVNISLQTDAQAASKPSNYLPPTPSLNPNAKDIYTFFYDGEAFLGCQQTKFG